MFRPLLLFALLTYCLHVSAQEKGFIEKLDPALDAIVDSDASVDIIATDFDWSEGPLWLEKQKMLIFSDVPQNIIYKWTPAKGKQKYLEPSGYTGTVPRGGEKGSNGLTLNNKGQLVICQDGDRRMAVMNADLSAPKPVFISITDNYKGKKFNSPNDAVYNANGDLFFTDPPYGLEKNMDDPLKELAFQGVFKVRKDGKLVLLTDTITRPNGIAITADKKTLLVANSDGKKPYWYAFDFGPGDKLLNPRIFCDASADAKKNLPGLPDGMKVDSKGNVFATGPGGVWVINKNGKLLGKIRWTKGPTSNCALSADEKTLYITADMDVLRVRLKKG